jgi:hypothetical protein
MPRNKKIERTPPEHKSQIINEELAYKKIINCTNTVELRNLGRYLYKIKCKWENRIKEFQLDGE